MMEEKDVLIRVRDGLRMGAKIYKPEGDGPFPILFATSPYRYDNNTLPAQPMFLWRETGPIEWYVDQGYAYVHADVRGTGRSEGEFEFLGQREQHDLYDVIEWIGTQPWCNGKVGGIGQSYYAMSQWFMGIENPPHLACIAPYDGLNDPYRYMGYPGGIEGSFLSYWFNSSVRVPNYYPANDHPRIVAPKPDLFYQVAINPLYNKWWKERAAFEQLEKITVPVFSIGVWAKLDLHLAGNIWGYKLSSGPKKLAISGTATPLTSQSDFATVEFHQRYLRPFYDKYLKGLTTSYDERPNVEYAVRNTGQMRSFETWPPPGTKPLHFYLSNGPSGSVTSINDGRLETAPRAPQDSGGGFTRYSYPHPSWAMGVVALGPAGPDPARGVLTFTTEPLEQDIEIAGTPKLILYASSSRNDTDFIVKLSEQFAQSAEERARGVQPRYFIATKGWLRASHMERDPRRSTEGTPYYTHERVTPLDPEKLYKFEIPMQPIAYLFRKGNRIRVEICNGDSPVTDSLFFHFYRPDKIGTDTIFHALSQLVLPVLE
ncbi:MAG TPA: CocE/NonD family hydrolase [Verrucomicrobiae bacterium]|nr:CocE/NonD family hydrolase [Verrucomicrobiae bacterium]